MRIKTFLNKEVYLLAIMLLTSQSLVLSAQSKLDLRTPKFQRVESAYSYIIQTENYFDLLLKSHPDMDSDIKKSKSLFSNSYGIAKINMKQYLISFYGNEKFEKFEEGFLNFLKENSEDMLNQISTKYDAIQALEEIDKRSNGEIDQNILRTILHFQYLANPLLEFTYGYTYTYKTKNHPKAKGSDWQLKIPFSWLSEEGNRPNIIQKFTSDAGDGSQTIMLMVFDLPNELHNLTDEEIDKQLDEENIITGLPKNSEIISFNKITIEGFKGVMVVYENISERLDVQVKIQVCSFSIIKDNQNFQIYCFLDSDDITSDISKEMNHYLPLFKSIVNSIVINDKYR